MHGCNLILLFSILLFHSSVKAGDFAKWDFYAHRVDDVLGRSVSLEKYRGKVSLVVNVASECGYTDGHYKEMVKLQRELAGDNFIILAFPCNQFGNQEPHDNAEIEEFVTKKFKINFPLFSKMNVRGQHSHSIYEFIKDKTGVEPSWNFWKFLINEDGHVIGSWGPRTSVNDVRGHVMKALKKTSHNEL